MIGYFASLMNLFRADIYELFSLMTKIAPRLFLDISRLHIMGFLAQAGKYPVVFLKPCLQSVQQERRRGFLEIGNQGAHILKALADVFFCCLVIRGITADYVVFFVSPDLKADIPQFNGTDKDKDILIEFRKIGKHRTAKDEIYDEIAEETGYHFLS
jgi:hypothetical protein